MSRHTGFQCLETRVSYVLNQHTASSTTTNQPRGVRENTSTQFAKEGRADLIADSLLRQSRTDSSRCGSSVSGWTGLLRIGCREAPPLVSAQR